MQLEKIPLKIPQIPIIYGLISLKNNQHLKLFLAEKYVNTIQDEIFKFLSL